MVSIKADRKRTRRQQMASPGSPLDRLIRLAQMALPITVGVMVAFFASYPFFQSSELSFLLDKNEVEIAPQRVKVTDAEYRGEDSKARPFSLKAKSAVQRSSDTPVVELNSMSALMQFPSGPAVLKADHGDYNMKQEKMQIKGPVSFNGANGYSLKTHDVDIDMSSRKLESRSRVNGTMPAGTFSADKLKADLENRVIRLEGNARLRMTQKRGRK